MNDTRIPRPEVRGVGHVTYRCDACGELVEPEAAVIRAGKSYHVEHTPEDDIEWPLTPV